MAECFQNRLQLILLHREITIHECVVVRTGERRPGVHAHVLRHLATARQGRRAPDDDFEHSIVRLSFHADNVLNRFAGDGIGCGHGCTAEGGRGLRIRRADFLHLRPNFVDGGGELFRRTFAADVHEKYFRIIVKEMVVQRGDRKAVVQRDAHHRIHLVLKEHVVAHDHRVVCFAFVERRPRSDSHKRRHRPAVHGNFYVGAWRGDFIDAFGGVPCAFDADDLLDLIGVERSEYGQRD